MKVLVIGGTGPTGPYLVQGLLDRGHETVILHRGVREPEGLPDVEHIHADPHFAETLEEAVRGRDFDVVLATYGRVKHIAQVFAGRCRQLVAVTGIAALENSLQPYLVRPEGLRVQAREDAPRSGDNAEAHIFSGKIAEAERSVLNRAAAGEYLGTIVRYSAIYGARNLMPREWSIVKRILDGRKHMYVADGGHEIHTRCAAHNAARHILLAVDNPEVANRQVYHSGDEDQFSIHQWIEIVSDIMGADLEIRSLPREIAAATFAETQSMDGTYSHMMVDTSKARYELGYKDAISARDATREYVQWLIENPPVSQDYSHFIDQFDYAAEDRLWNAYRQAITTIPHDVLRHPPGRAHAHPMPHPKKAQLARDHAGR